MRLGLIAGSGLLPHLLVLHCHEQNIPTIVVGIQGYCDASMGDVFQNIPLGRIGDVLTFLKLHDVTHICFAGGLKRPDFSSLKVDRVGAQWLIKLGLRIFKGDNALLSGLLELFAQEGFIPISARELLPSLSLSSGHYGSALTSQQVFDIEFGKRILNQTSDLDMGQAVIVQEGHILGIEAAEGTQALIERCAHYRSQPGGILIKKTKTNQTHLADLPTIGLETITQLAHYHYEGLAIDVYTQVLEYDKTIQTINELNVFCNVF